MFHDACFTTWPVMITCTICFTTCLFISPDLDGHDMFHDMFVYCGHRATNERYDAPLRRNMRLTTSSDCDLGTIHSAPHRTDALKTRGMHCSSSVRTRSKFWQRTAGSGLASLLGVVGMAASSSAMAVPVSSHGSSARGGSGMSFSVLTWNIWFENLHYETRMREIFRQCSALKPDIIAFQEVLPPFVKALQSEEWARDYRHGDRDGSTVDPYGVLLLSKLPCSMTSYAMPTRMGRSILTAEVNLGEGLAPVTVATVHLESLNSPDVREQQIKVAADVLKDKGNALLVGDFNFCSYRSWEEGRMLEREGRANDSPLENQVLKRHLADFTDLWPELHPHDKGYTFDSARNGVIRRYEQMRYDRILSKMGDGGWRAVSMEMLGTEAIEGQENWLRPSDHFGLLARFERSQEKKEGGEL